MYDPTIGRFIQPDTIIPSLANPQSWNRFAYVSNNPVKYTDPTGHKPCWATAQYSCNATPKQIDEWRAAHGFGPYRQLSVLRAITPFAWGDCASGETYKECWYDQKLMRFADLQQVDQDQFNDLMMAVYYDLKEHSLGSQLLWHLVKDDYRVTYDTPFWNGKTAYGPNPDQKVCLGQNCYWRSDINYFAQGMWAAAGNETQDQAVTDAAKWKSDTYHQALSPNTEFWVRYGYNAYQVLDATFGDLIVSGDFDKYYNH